MTEQPRLEVTGQAAWIGNGCHHVAVEITNRGATVYYPEVAVTYYDAGNRVVGRRSARAHLFRVAPRGMTTTRLAIDPPVGWSRHEVAVSWPAIDEGFFAVDLEVADLRAARSDRTVSVSGTLRNRGITLVGDAVVDVALYRDGQLLEAAAVRPFGDARARLGASAPFAVRFFDPDGRLIGAEPIARADGIPLYASD